MQIMSYTNGIITNRFGFKDCIIPGNNKIIMLFLIFRKIHIMFELHSYVAYVIESIKNAVRLKLSGVS